MHRAGLFLYQRKLSLEENHSLNGTTYKAAAVLQELREHLQCIPTHALLHSTLPVTFSNRHTPHMSSGKFSDRHIMRNSLTVTPHALQLSILACTLTFHLLRYGLNHIYYITSHHRTCEKGKSNARFRHARAIGSQCAEKSH